MERFSSRMSRSVVPRSALSSSCIYTEFRFPLILMTMRLHTVLKEFHHHQSSYLHFQVIYSPIRGLKVARARLAPTWKIFFSQKIPFGSSIMMTSRLPCSPCLLCHRQRHRAHTFQTNIPPLAKACPREGRYLFQLPLIQSVSDKCMLWRGCVTKRSIWRLGRSEGSEPPRKLGRSNWTKKSNSCWSWKKKRIYLGKTLPLVFRPTLARPIKSQPCKCVSNDCESAWGHGRRRMYILLSFVLPRIGRLILRTGSSTRASLRLLGEVPVRHYRRKGN